MSILDILKKIELNELTPEETNEILLNYLLYTNGMLELQEEDEIKLRLNAENMIYNYSRKRK